MKTFTSLLITCSLVLAGAAMAQQPGEQASPTEKKKQGAEKAHAAEVKPGAKKEGGAAATERAAGKGHKGRAGQESATGQGTNVSGQPGATVAPAGKQQAEHGRKGMKEHEHAAKTSASPAATPATAGAAVSAAPSVSAAGQQTGRAGGKGAAKKLEAQQVQQIKSQHANFRAQPKPQQVPAVTFNQNYRIEGSDRWQGPQYEVFRSYHPEWHDQGWYRSRFGRVELIGGGYYYWHNGYWYPAWGYDPSAQYYAYDGPIYVGHRAEPPDRVIADVQAELQEMGYYKGEVDGLLGPLSREALTAYQADHGLATTAAIDEPTLDSLGMS